ncbi:hypothetical protein [uncultured Desulfuromonas sp.]|uniref:hypothetical protein n=1 Tax=uncultured Desulfuromonas sp. TaxID=181013 RepID=UPI002AAA744D|nr:hypothetical protein [uncultured Desulfuromonas sp.]
MRKTSRLAALQGFGRERSNTNEKQISGLLMEVGAPYSKRRSHGKKYLSELLEQVEDVPDSVKELLVLSRGNLELFTAVQKKLTESLREEPLIQERVEHLMSIP